MRSIRVSHVVFGAALNLIFRRDAPAAAGRRSMPLPRTTATIFLRDRLCQFLSLWSVGPDFVAPRLTTGWIFR
jgi:hypothetical protein